MVPDQAHVAAGNALAAALARRLRSGGPQQVATAQALSVRETWREEPLGIRDWLDSSYHCGVSGHIYPRVEGTLCRVFGGPSDDPGLALGPAPHGGKINELALCWGIGSGKSFLTSLVAAYVIYRLGCMQDPAVTMGLAPGSDIVLANVSTGEDQARRVIFNDIKKRCEAGWFADNYSPNRRVTSELQFPRSVKVFPGNSKSDKVLGLNVVLGMIDEAAFHQEVADSARAYATAEVGEGYSGATELYHALQERAQSRFGQGYLLVTISSPLYAGDFIQRRLREFALGAPGIYAEHAAQWEVKPPKAYDSVPGSFYFDPLTRQIYDEVPVGFDGQVKAWAGGTRHVVTA